MKTRLLLLCFVSIILPALLAGIARASEPLPPALPIDDVDFLIVTNDEMAAEFQRLADARASEGLRSRVVTVSWIQSVTPAGADLRETLREFLRAAYLDWGIEYLLLAGDNPILPARFAWIDFGWPEIRPNVASDLYFACLNGNWDGDGDGLYGEPEGDDVDLIPELKVGRAPVNSAAEAAVFVDKTLAYATVPNRARLDDALLMAEVLSPYPWYPGQPIYLNGAQQAEALAGALAGSEFAYRACRLYQNTDGYPGAYALGRQAALDSLSSGRYGLVSFVGHADGDAWSVGAPELITLEDFSGLSNGAATFVVEALACFSTDFPDTTVFEAMLLSPNGGCVAAVGSSGEGFLSPAFAIQQAFFTAAASANPARLGDVMATAQTVYRSRVDLGHDDYFQAYVTYLLLGDPTLQVGSAITTAVPSTPDGGIAVTVDQCVPNPFNPIGRVRFTISGQDGQTFPTTVEVCDLGGRHVRTIVEGALPAGRHEVIWNGRDERGRALASGLYLVRVVAAGRVATAKFTLVR